MKITATAALRALALASLAAAATPVDAARLRLPIGTPVVIPHIFGEPVPCLRAPAYRPPFCFRHDMRWRAAYWNRLSRAQRTAFLEHRYWGYNR